MNSINIAPSYFPIKWFRFVNSKIYSNTRSIFTIIVLRNRVIVIYSKIHIIFLQWIQRSIYKFQIYIYIFLLTIERIFCSRRKISRGADSKRQITRVTAMSRPADISTGNLRCCYCADTGQPFFSLSFPERVGRRNMERSGNKSRIYNWITRLSRWRPFPPLLSRPAKLPPLRVFEG